MRAGDVDSAPDLCTGKSQSDQWNRFGADVLIFAKLTNPVSSYPQDSAKTGVES